jgi:sulfide:quinone oxidoreductase
MSAISASAASANQGLLESAFRERHIKWIVNAKTTKVDEGVMHVMEVDEDGKDKRAHDLPFKFAMMLPAFRGIPAVTGIEGLTNPRGLILVDKHQRNARFPNIFSVGVSIAIPPIEKTPLPTGVPKTGFMIESMVSAAARNIRALIDGKEPSEQATWNAVCLADFGDKGVAFVAIPEIPPRNVNWSSHGRWVHTAKVAFEKYFLRKIRKGISEPIYESYILKLMGIDKLIREQRDKPTAA